MTESRAGFRPPVKESGVTVAEMADAREAGYDDGFKEGKAEGYAAGLAEGQAELAKKMEIEMTKIRQLIQAMQHPFQDYRQDLVSELKMLSTEICRTFLHHQVTQDQALLEYLIDESVQQLLPTDHQIVIHVNQHNSAVVQRALMNHLDENGWRVQLNHKLSDGNVFLESGHSRVKIDVPALLNQYIQQLKDNA